MPDLFQIQNADRAIGPRDYKALGDKLLVTSIFKTIQGEGPFAGRPSVFIRLAGCNRGAKDPKSQCAFCDTRFHFDEGVAMAVPDIVDRAIALTPTAQTYRGKPLVVITGGEPMMQDNLIDLLKVLTPNFMVQIESNGDRLIPGFESILLKHRVVLVVSPKAYPNGYTRPHGDVWRAAGHFKFLLDARPESGPYHTVPEDYLKDDRPVWVSPITVYKRPVRPSETPSIWDHDLVDAAQTARNAEYAAAYACAHGLRVSLQSHLWMAIA